jgi:hypothetical protein
VLLYVQDSLTEDVGTGNDGCHVEPLEEQLASWEKLTDSVAPTTSFATNNIENTCTAPTTLVEVSIHATLP